MALLRVISLGLQDLTRVLCERSLIATDDNVRTNYLGKKTPFPQIIYKRLLHQPTALPICDAVTFSHLPIPPHFHSTSEKTPTVQYPFPLLGRLAGSKLSWSLVVTIL